MAIMGILGCETVPSTEVVPSKDRLEANEKEALDLCQKIDNGELHGSYTFGENNKGIYGDIAISIYNEKNNTIQSYAFKRNEKGYFDKVKSVRPVVIKEATNPVVKETVKWVPYQIPAREL